MNITSVRPISTILIWRQAESPANWEPLKLGHIGPLILSVVKKVTLAVEEVTSNERVMYYTEQLPRTNITEHFDRIQILKVSQTFGKYTLYIHHHA